MRRFLLGATACLMCAAAMIVPGTAAASDDLMARLDSLQRENAAMRKEIAALRQQRSAAPHAVDTRNAPGRQLSPAAAAALARPARPTAADGPAYNAMAMAAPVQSWTGFYIGANLGYGWGNVRTDVGGNGSNVTFPGTPILNNNLGFSGTDEASLNGIMGGGQIGYNFQFHPNWLLGFEADLQASGLRARKTFSTPFTGDICVIGAPPVCLVTSPLSGATTIGYESKIDWFGTVRGRIGWFANNQTLFYATGGLAYGRVSVAGDINTSAAIPFGGGTSFSGTNAFGASEMRYGFAVGGGIEGSLTALLPAGWTWKVEYLYVDLGSLKTSSPFVLAPSGGFSDIVGTTTTETRFADHVVRVGLNYGFGPL